MAKKEAEIRARHEAMFEREEVYEAKLLSGNGDRPYHTSPPRDDRSAGSGGSIVDHGFSPPATSNWRTDRSPSLSPDSSPGRLTSPTRIQTLDTDGRILGYEDFGGAQPSESRQPSSNGTMRQRGTLPSRTGSGRPTSSRGSRRTGGDSARTGSGRPPRSSAPAPAAGDLDLKAAAAFTADGDAALDAILNGDMSHMGADATIRFMKAKLRVMQQEAANSAACVPDSSNPDPNRAACPPICWRMRLYDTGSLKRDTVLTKCLCTIVLSRQ